MFVHAGLFDHELLRNLVEILRTTEYSRAVDLLEILISIAQLYV